MLIFEHLTVSTKGHTDIIDITNDLRKIIRHHRIAEGIMIVTVKGSTASISTIEYEPNLVRDIQEILEKLVPSHYPYHHHKTWGDDNGHAHVRATIFGPSESFIIRGSDILLGTWQQVVLIDFDTRPRTRTIYVAIYTERTG